MEGMWTNVSTIKCELISNLCTTLYYHTGRHRHRFTWSAFSSCQTDRRQCSYIHFVPCPSLVFIWFLTWYGTVEPGHVARTQVAGFVFISTPTDIMWKGSIVEISMMWTINFSLTLFVFYFYFVVTSTVKIHTNISTIIRLKDQELFNAN